MTRAAGDARHFVSAGAASCLIVQPFVVDYAIVDRRYTRRRDAGIVCASRIGVPQPREARRVMSKIRRVVLTHLRQPLVQPYRLSYRTFTEFEPFLVELEDDEGRTGFSDGHVSPGSSSETREGAWAFTTALIPSLIGLDTAQAKELAQAQFSHSKVASTGLATAIEVLEGHPALALSAAQTLPLLVPVNGLSAPQIEAELEEQIAAGFRTFKVKVGKDVDADLARVGAIQRVCRGRATIRLDANRAYSRDDGVRFARALDPDGIELFEQPCDSDDWDANAAVAAVSTVPLMLDEPICTLEDIARAATIQGVGYCKLKLKRFGSMSQLITGLDHVRACGLKPVLGDGLGSEVHNWLEACCAVGHIDNAGEFNGFLKPTERLMTPPLLFRRGALELPAVYRPTLDRAQVEKFTVTQLAFN